MYTQIQGNALQNGVAQGSNFWNLYTVGTGADDPYQVTLADTSTMDVIGAHVRPRARALAASKRVSGLLPKRRPERADAESA